MPRRVARVIYHLVLGRMPADGPGRSRRGTAAPGEPALKLLQVGDCGFRRMELGHDMTAPDAEMKATAARCGVAVLDAADTLRFDRSLRCANAYNLNARGSRGVGELLADWIAEHVLAPERLEQPRVIA